MKWGRKDRCPQCLGPTEHGGHPLPQTPRVGSVRCDTAGGPTAQTFG